MPRDGKPMDDSDISPSAHGILQCLRALAQEAASLNLPLTLSAIEDAFEAASCESGLETTDIIRASPARRIFH